MMLCTTFFYWGQSFAKKSFCGLRSGMPIPKFCNIIAKIKKKYPVHDLCKYILNELGDIDLKNYQVISSLERP